MKSKTKLKIIAILPGLVMAIFFGYGYFHWEAGISRPVKSAINIPDSWAVKDGEYGQLLVRTSAASSADDFEAGDIVGAFNRKRILDVHAQNIIDQQHYGFNQYNLRQPGTLLDIYLSQSKEYKFQRISETEVRKINLRTGASEVISDQMNPAGERIDVSTYLARRLISPKHQIFGLPGREYWYGGGNVLDEQGLDKVWTAIETVTDFRRENFNSYVMSPVEQKNYKLVAVDDFSDELAGELTSNVLIGDKDTGNRKFAFNPDNISQARTVAALTELKHEETRFAHEPSVFKKIELGTIATLHKIALSLNYTISHHASAAGTVTTSIGTRAAENVDITSVTGSGPYTVTLSGAPSTETVVGDTLSDEAATPKSYLIVGISSNVLTVRDAFGAAAAPSAAGSSQAKTTRTHSSITNWEATLDVTQLYSSGDSAVGEVYNDSVYSESVAINGGGTVGLASLTLTAPVGERHDGTAGSGARIMRSGISTLITSGRANTTISWLELDGNSTRGGGLTVTQADSVMIENNLVYNIDDSSNSDINGIGSASPSGTAEANAVIIQNNIVYNIRVNTTTTNREVAGIGVDANGNRWKKILNNTVYNVKRDQSNQEGFGIGGQDGTNLSDSAKYVVKNNIAVGTGGSSTGLISDFAFAGSTAVASSNNLSSDASADDGGGSGNLINQTIADLFVSTTAGSEDFHLKSGSPAINAGADLGTSPTNVNIDIDGRDRDALNDVWDIGADEFVAVVGGVTISGTVYSDEGSTVLTTTPTVRIKVNGAGDFSAAADGSGAYSVSNVSIAIGSDVVTAYLDNATEKAVTITRAADNSSDITGLNLYQNYVIVRHEDSGPVTNANLGQYDNDNDADINFTSNSGSLTVLNSNTLYVLSGEEFAPGGSVAAPKLKNAGTFTAGSNTVTITGTGTSTSRPFVNTGTFAAGTSTVVYNGNGDTDIENVTYYNLTFNPLQSSSGKIYSIVSGAFGVSHDWDINPDAASALNLSVVLNGATTVSGTLTIEKSNSATSSLSTNVSDYALNAGSINIATGGTLTANGATITLTGAGTPFTVPGTFNAGSSTVVYNSTSATNIAATTYNNLSLTPAGTPTYTLGTASSQTINIGGNFTIGNGTNALAVNHATYDPAINIGGNFTIAASAGAFTKSDSAAAITLKPSGTKTWTDNTGLDVGVVVIGSGSSTPKISLGSGVKATNVTINSSHELDLGSYTLALTGTGTPLGISGTFTPATGTVQYTGTSASITASTYNALTLGGSGTYSLPNTNLILRGDLTVTNGATITKGSGTLIFAKGGVQTLTDSNTTKQDLGSIQVSSNTTDTTLNAGSDLKLTAVTVDESQTFDLAGGARILTLTSNSAPLSVSGTLVDTDDTIVFAPASSGTVAIPVRTYSNVTFNGSGSTFRAAAGTLNFDGNVIVTAGTLDLNTNDPTTQIAGTLTLAGTLDASSANALTLKNNFTNNGTFDHNNGEVILDPTGSTVTVNGSAATTNFYSLTMNKPNSTLVFKAGNTYGFSGTLTLNGSDSMPMNVQSDSSGSQWLITFTGTAAMDNLRVKDAGCSGGNDVLVGQNVFSWGNNGSCWRIIIRGGSSGATNGSSGGGDGQTGGGAGGGGSVGEDGSSGGGDGQTGGGAGGGGNESP